MSAPIREPPEILFGRWRPYAAAVARRMVRSGQSADVGPAVNAALYGLWQAAQTWNPGGVASFKSWALWRVRGAILDHFREEHGRYGHRRLPALRLSDVEGAAALAVPAREPAVDGLDAVEGLARQLPPNYAHVIREYYGRGRMLRDIAADLGVCPGRASQMRSFGVAMLREILEGNGP